MKAPPIGLRRPGWASHLTVVVLVLFGAGPDGMGLEGAEPEGPDPAPAELVLPALQQVQRDQQVLREAVERLANRQERSLEQYVGQMREEQRSLSARLTQDRERELNSLIGQGRWIVNTTLAIGGVVLAALGVLAWGFLRALQRLHHRSMILPRAMTRHDEAGLPVLPDAELLTALVQLEKRLLQLSELAARPLPPSNGRETAGVSEERKSLPGDFL